MKRIFLISSIFLCLAAWASAGQDVDESEESGLPLTLGAGLRIQNNLPIVLAELRIGLIALGTEAGVNTSRFSMDGLEVEVSSAFNSGYGKVYVPMGDLPISLYGGGGFMLITAEAEITAENIDISNEFTTTALLAFAGIETRIGLMAFFADFRIQPISTSSFTVNGTTIDTPVGLSTLSADFGVRFEYQFSLM